MQAMILAAGRGERMRPLTDVCPKPLLPVGGTPLMVWHLEKLAGMGVSRVMVNHAHLGGLIESRLGDGTEWGLDIRYSPEPPGALETAGGIATALSRWPLGVDETFLVINGDVWCDVDFSMLTPPLGSDLARILLVPNPAHHPAGDFVLDGARVRNRSEAAASLTYAGIGLFSPRLFRDVVPDTPARLAPLLRQAADEQRLAGIRYVGRWEDIGTPQRLQQLDQELLSLREVCP